MAKRKPKYRPRADAARIRRLETYIKALETADGAVAKCRADTAKCVKRYGATLKAAKRELARYQRSLRDDDPARLWEDPPSALALAGELKAPLATERETLSDVKREATTARRRIVARRKRVIVVVR